MNMSTLKIKEALAAAGIDAIETEVMKNGVSCTGFRLITASDINPVIYYSQDETIESFVRRALIVQEQPTPNFSIEKIISKENILNNAYLCVQKKSSENIVKRDYLNLDLYIRVEVKNFGYEQGTLATIKMTNQILSYVGLTEDEIFAIARFNSVKKAEIKSMAEVLGLPDELSNDISMYVATYKDNNGHGAAVLALKEVFSEFCESRNCDSCLIIPSSTEELLLLPGNENYQKDEIIAMIDEINLTQVDEVLRLEAVLYEYNIQKDEIIITAPSKEVQ